MTSTELKEFKEEIKEEILLLIPEVVGNMIMEIKSLSEMNEDFYKKHLGGYTLQADEEMFIKISQEFYRAIKNRLELNSLIDRSTLTC